MAQSINNLPIGALIKDPGTTHLNVPIKWKIVDRNHAGYPENSTTLIAENVITYKAYDAAESSNFIPENASNYTYGYNRYLSSNIRQWLNSDAAAGQWFTAQSNCDNPPSADYVEEPLDAYDQKPGFLHTFSQTFKSLLLDTSLISALYPVINGVTSEAVIDKLFLPSCTEVGLGSKVSGMSGTTVAEGTQLAYFTSNSSRVAYSTDEAEIEDNSSTTTASRAAFWATRTPGSLASMILNVQSGGSSVTSSAVYMNKGIRPACNITSAAYVSDTVDEDGCYTLLAGTDYRLITWLDDDDSVLASSHTLVGEIPTCPIGEPTKPRNDRIFYNFAGWTPALTAVSAEATYKATYTTEPAYLYTFYGKDGTTILKSDYLRKGDTIISPEKAPTEPGYIFKNYSNYTQGMTISEDIEFVAQYQLIPGFINAEGAANLLKSVKIQYANLPLATANFENKIVQLTQDGTYNNTPVYKGYSYTCVKNNSTDLYSWENIDVQPRFLTSLRDAGTNSVKSTYANNTIGNNSFAFGVNAAALGNYSIALGYKCRGAENTMATFAAGYNCTANKNYSVCIGYSSIVNATYATALGAYHNVSGSYSFAAGRNCNVASGMYGAIATGYYTNVNADYGAHAAGRNVATSIDSSFICGQYGNLTTSYSNTVFAVASGNSSSNHIGMHFAGLNGNGVLYIENKPAVTSTQGLTSIWAGNQSQYDAISSKNATTLYIITQ